MNDELGRDSSETLDALLRAARNAGVPALHAEVTVRTVLECLTEHMPVASRSALLAALPIDARAFALPPERRHPGDTARGREALALVEMAADLHGNEAGALRVVRAVLQVLDERVTVVGSRVSAAWPRPLETGSEPSPTRRIPARTP